MYRFWENPVGIIAVGVAVGLYFLFFVFARRKDKLSRLKVCYALWHSTIACGVSLANIDLVL